MRTNIFILIAIIFILSLIVIASLVPERYAMNIFSTISIVGGILVYISCRKKNHKKA